MPFGTNDMCSFCEREMPLSVFVHRPLRWWVSEWRSISLTLLSVTARQYLRRANWALLSHSLGCFTDEKAMAPLPLSNSSWLECLPCCVRVSWSSVASASAPSRESGRTRVGLWALCVSSGCCVETHLRRLQLGKRTFLLWCPKIKAADGHRENSWGTTARKWLEVLSPFWEVQARPENRSGVNFFSFCKLVKTDCSREF